MTPLLRHAAAVLARLPYRWAGRIDASLDHGHIPYAAWAAELTAYARLRAEMPVKVTFGLGAHCGWDDEVQLAKAPPGHDPADAFRTVELELEHQLMHHRQGCREVALLWHTWVHPDEEMTLPWPPWDAVTLPASVVRYALEHAVASLQLPGTRARTPERVRHASRWLYAAWQDGSHRAAEVEARPGLADRLALPPPPGRSARHRVWQHVLFALATRSWGDSVALDVTTREALERLIGVRGDDRAGQIVAVLALAEALGAAQALPPVPEQRPGWLGPPWGRWQYGKQLRATLDDLVRRPNPDALQSLSSQRRAAFHRTTVAFAAGSRGAGLGAGKIAPQTGDTASAAASPVSHPDQVEADQPPEGWGPRSGNELRRHNGGGESRGVAATAEGSGGGVGGTGTGAASLGALHVVVPTAEDRSAYWQLRGALAPQIEQLVERLRAASDAYYAAAPRRFQRSGRIDRCRLPGALAGREAVFTRFVHVPAPEHAMCLLLDTSASMHRYAELVREMAIVIEAAATAAGARVNAFSFGAAWESMEPASRGAPLLALGRELKPHGGTPFGPALATAAAWLAQQPFEQKRLWVFSDGRWSARDRAEEGWRADHLRNVVVWVLDDTAPEPPHPAMSLVAVPALADLIRHAPRYFWSNPRPVAPALPG